MKPCSCTPVQVQRYQSRISGPLLDRFDLQIEVPRLQEFEFETVKSGESSLNIRHRVERARQIQRQRYQGSRSFCNAAMNHKQIREFCRIDAGGQQLLRQALQRFGLSARAYSRILKLARTIADIEGIKSINSGHLAEAIQYRNMDRH